MIFCAARTISVLVFVSIVSSPCVQDAQAEADVGAYVDHGLKVGVEDPAALVYFADLENQGGGGASARVAAAAKKPVTLDTIHAAGLADRVMGKYSTRRKNVYSAAKKLDWKGAGSMKASVLIQKLRDIVRNFKTLYVMGCFGAPLTGGNVTRYCQNHEYSCTQFLNAGEHSITTPPPTYTPIWPDSHTASPGMIFVKSVDTSLQSRIMPSAPVSGTPFAL